MGAAGAHQLAAVLEDLDPAIALAQLVRLVGPDVDHRTNLLAAHRRQPQVVAWREADDAACSPFALGDGQARFEAPTGGFRGQRAEVVLEDERALVSRVARAIGT